MCKKFRDNLIEILEKVSEISDKSGRGASGYWIFVNKSKNLATIY